MAYLIQLPDPQTFANNAVTTGMVQVGLAAAALSGILVLVMIFKAIRSG
jgi:hypothetical protein